jgi:hypothetical protein
MRKFNPCKCNSDKICIAKFPTGIFCYCWDCSLHGPKRKTEKGAIEAWNSWVKKAEEAND